MYVPYTLGFEISRNQGWSGDVALDNIFFREGYCPSLLGASGSCTFDSGTCNFENDPNADYHWKYEHYYGSGEESQNLMHNYQLEFLTFF